MNLFDTVSILHLSRNKQREKSLKKKVQRGLLELLSISTFVVFL